MTRFAQSRHVSIADTVEITAGDRAALRREFVQPLQPGLEDGGVDLIEPAIHPDQWMAIPGALTVVPYRSSHGHALGRVGHQRAAVAGSAEILGRIKAI